MSGELRPPMTTRRLVLIAIAVWIVAIVLWVYPYVLTSHRLTFTVTLNDAASACRSQSTMLTGFGRYRSAITLETGPDVGRFSRPPPEW